MPATSLLGGRFRSLRELRRAFPARIDRYKRASKGRVRATLLADPEIAAAVRDHAASTGEAEEASWRRVHAYLDEIVPSFSLFVYYRLGYGLARALLPLLYKVGVGYEAAEALRRMPRDAVVVYLMNHRSNVDYVVAAYVLSGKVAVSYAVGEWARVWPLEELFKRFGSYFVRRGYPELLYHKVLERYVQLITKNGVTQGIFLEGGLSRDGRFRPPKLGLFDDIARAKLDPAFTRPIYLVPVAINYDRVLEDRSLLRELQAPEARLARREQMTEVASYLLKVSIRFLLRRARRYGRACVNFGAPVCLDEWLAQHPGVLRLPRAERLARLETLAREVMARISAIMPVTPVPLASAALLQHPGDRITHGQWESLMSDLRFVLRGAGAPIVGDEKSSREILDRALVMLTLRRVVSPDGDGFRVDRGQDLLLQYYANSIAHFFPAP
ncbi:MAG TPA: 1-acyl-sn-glycerol-3-phosphate acyltransferase [Vicinamibacteria bacterium]